MERDISKKLNIFQTLRELSFVHLLHFVQVRTKAVNQNIEWLYLAKWTWAQLLSPNKFCLNILSISTVIYTQSIEIILYK